MIIKYWIICSVIAGSVAIIGWFFHNQRQADINAINQREKLEEQKRCDEKIKEGHRLMTSLEKYLTPCLIIDSNIWMNKSYAALLCVLARLCLSKKYKLILYGPQFDEISNIKKNTTYGEAKNSSARIALRRIDAFQKTGLLAIKSITIDSQKNAYADPMMVKLLIEESRKGVRCTFISDDVELRVRVREHLSNYAEADWEILEGDELLPKCELILEAEKLEQSGAKDITTLKNIESEV